MAGSQKTKPSDADVSAFIALIEDPSRREDAEALTRMMRAATGATPLLWGGRMVGFGSYHFRYASGREGDWFKVGFALGSRKLTLYLMSGLDGCSDLLPKLGPHSGQNACLYLRRLADVDVDVLDAMIRRSVAHLDQVEADKGAVPRMSEMPPPKPGRDAQDT
jgi:hypothetical protein